jgi:hypothetical protein
MAGAGYTLVIGVPFDKLLESWFFSLPPPSARPPQHVPGGADVGEEGIDTKCPEKDTLQSLKYFHQLAKITFVPSGALCDLFLITVMTIQGRYYVFKPYVNFLKINSDRILCLGYFNLANMHFFL